MTELNTELPMTTEPAMPYANFFERLIAKLIDSVLVAIPMGLISWTTDVSEIGFIAPLLYYPVFEGSGVQATIGKRVMGLIVVDEKGGRLTVRASLIRFFMTLVSGMVFFLGYFVFFFTKKKQTLHDLVAQTLVIRGRREGEMGPAWAEQLRSWFR